MSGLRGWSRYPGQQRTDSLKTSGKRLLSGRQIKSPVVSCWNSGQKKISDACIKCKTCVRNCPADAIGIENKPFGLEACIGCYGYIRVYILYYYKKGKKDCNEKWEEWSEMKVAILNGSPKVGNTAAMIRAFAEGVEASGHEVEILHVGRMKIAGCLACEYCHGKGEGSCIQKDDMEKVMPAYREADIIVYASPIYYFGMTAQIMAAIQRVYAIGKPVKAKKSVLLLSSGSPNPYAGAIATYKDMLAYTGIEDAGIITAAGEENGSEAKLAEIREFAKGL